MTAVDLTPPVKSSQFIGLRTTNNRTTTQRGGISNNNYMLFSHRKSTSNRCLSPSNNNTFLLLLWTLLLFFTFILIQQQQPFRVSALANNSDSTTTTSCSSRFTCFACLSNATTTTTSTTDNNSTCKWCAHTLTCIDQSLNCTMQEFASSSSLSRPSPLFPQQQDPHSPHMQKLKDMYTLSGAEKIQSIGTVGVRPTSANTLFYNTIGVKNQASLDSESNVLRGCALEVNDVSQCVIGAQFSQIYLPYSLSTRNLQPAGLQKQPILPIASEFFRAYFRPSNDSEKLGLDEREGDTIGNDVSQWTEDELMHRVVHELTAFRPKDDSVNRTKLIVGAYMIGSSPGKSVNPFIMFSSVGFEAKMTNYTFSEEDGSFEVHRSNHKNQKMLLHLLPTNIGLHAERGSYRMGVMVALVNEANENEPVCLFYPLPSKITVTPVWRDAVLGIYLYAGLPIFFVGLILISIYTVFCPFVDSKQLSQEAYEEKERQELNDLKNESGEIIDETAVNEAKLSGARGRIYNISQFWKYNSDTIIANSGLRGYYYWKFYRRIVLIVLLYAVLALAIILPINIVYNYKVQTVIDLAVTTFGSIDTTGRVSIAHYVVGVLFFLITVAVYTFSIRLTFYKRRYESSVFTARLRHLPVMSINIGEDSEGRAYITNSIDIERREKLLMHHFNQVLRKEMKKEATKNPEDKAVAEMVDTDLVLSVNLIADMSHIMSDIDTQYQLEQTINSSSSSKEGFIARARAKRLNNSRKAMFKKIESRPVSTTQAFITFKSVLALRKCKVIYKSMTRKNRTKTPFSDEISCSVDTWKMRQVTWEPEDVNWNNIYDSTRRNVFGATMVYIAYFIVYALLIGALLVYFFRFGVYGLFSGLRYRQSFVIMRSAAFLKWLIPVVLGFASSVFSVFLTIAGEISNLVMRTVTGLERMKSKSKASASYLLKSVAIIIPFYLTIPFLGDYQVERVHPESFYSNTGLALIQFILSYLFFYKGIELLGCVAKVTLSYIMTSGEPERIPFEFNVSYTSALTNFFIIAVTGIRIPLIFIPGVAFFIMTYFVDTFLLLYFYQRAVGTGRIEFALVSVLLLVFGAAAMLFHPSLSLLLAFGSIIFVAIALSVISVMVYVYNRRGNKRSTNTLVTNEAVYANKYAQPHLKILLRRPTTAQDVELQPSSPSSPLTPMTPMSMHAEASVPLNEPSPMIV